MSASLQDQFDAAAAKARETPVSGSNVTKLQIYGLFKQATEGPIGDRKRPAVYDLTGRAKYDRWKELGNMPQDEAMQQYIALINTL